MQSTVQYTAPKEGKNYFLLLPFQAGKRKKVSIFPPPPLPRSVHVRESQPFLVPSSEWDGRPGRKKDICVPGVRTCVYMKEHGSDGAPAVDEEERLFLQRIRGGDDEKGGKGGRRKKRRRRRGGERRGESATIKNASLMSVPPLFSRRCEATATKGPLAKSSGRRNRARARMGEAQKKGDSMNPERGGTALYPLLTAAAAGSGRMLHFCAPRPLFFAAIVLHCPAYVHAITIGVGGTAHISGFFDALFLHFSSSAGKKRISPKARDGSPQVQRLLSAAATDERGGGGSGGSHRRRQWQQQ